MAHRLYTNICLTNHTMQYRQLGQTQIKVSVICLGTMTWGEQNTESEAHSQLDYAISTGINFIDAAEMYPVPPRQETQGLTETFLGNWLAKNKNRNQLIIATKVAGPGMMPYLRHGPQLNRPQIEQALHDSLQRLQTDYIDLYQVHWPARQTNFFGKLGYAHQADEDGPAIAETLEILNEFVQAGKIRHLGISNETPWGTMQYIHAADQNGHARIVSVQNPYSLLNRTFEIGLAEIAHREHVGLLAYSPLGFGVLSGKYLNQQKPPGARLSLFEYFTRYTNPLGIEATKRYVQLAADAGMDSSVMALAYVNSRSFVTADIIGATSQEQLEANISSMDVTLSDDLIAAIEEVHEAIPNPCP